VPTEDLPRAVERAGCGVVAWLGGPQGAAAARRALMAAGLRGVAFTAGPAVKDPTFLEEAGQAGEGTVVACGCADLTLSTAPSARRFIHDYAESFGTAPGPHAVEGYDAGSLLARALAAGGLTRDGAARGLAGIARLDGLAVRYRFGPDGELVDPLAHVVLYRDDGGRWVAIGR
jgi:branched-chain amino acid transport system substrate-binding protein